VAKLISSRFMRCLFGAGFPQQPGGRIAAKCVPARAEMGGVQIF